MGKGQRNREFRNVVGIKPRIIPKRPDRKHRTPAEVAELLRKHAGALAQGKTRRDE